MASTNGDGGKPKPGTTIASSLLLDAHTSPNAVLPSQYYTITRTSIGTRELCRAILGQAIDDYMMGPFARGQPFPPYRTAQTWFMRINNSTYELVCDVLGVNPDYLWERLQQYTGTFERPRMHAQNHRDRRINGRFHSRH